MRWDIEVIVRSKTWGTEIAKTVFPSKRQAIKYLKSSKLSLKPKEKEVG